MSNKSYNPILVGLGEFTMLVVVAVVLSDGAVQLTGISRDSNAFAVVTLAVAVVVTGVYLWFARALENRKAAELRLEAASGFLPGFGLGLLMFAVVMGILVAVGAYTVGKGSGASVLFYGVVTSVATGVFEELAFRGILLGQFERSLGSIWALVISSVIFGAMHIPNPHATLVTGLIITVEAGSLLGAAYLATRSLWFPIGLHAAWDFAEGGFFGVRDSGQNVRGFLSSVPVPGHSLSGGSFGAEGSIVAVVVCVLASAGLYVLAAKRGNIRPAARSAFIPS